MVKMLKGSGIFFGNSFASQKKWQLQWRSQPDNLIMLCKYFGVHTP
jgi:hypothetical protein